MTVRRHLLVTLESVLSNESGISGEEEDIDMIGAQYITEEEAAEVTEVQIQLEMALARGMRLGAEVLD